MRQVIFIAGTAYSGSSMLDMILGSSGSSFSMGEVRALFYPTKMYHIKPPCGCGDNNCTIWQSVEKLGEYNLYPNIFDRFPETKTIIDSSKEPFWISKQRARLKQIGIKTKVILVWKSPHEFALSRLKRGNLKSWYQSWVNYHRLFLSLIKDENWRSVSYMDLAVTPVRTIEKLCNTVGVRYNPKIINYWEKKHHILFGNTVAKYHMYEKNNENFKKSLKNLNEIEMGFDHEKNELEERHQSIYYVTDFINQLPQSVHSTLKNNQIHKAVIDIIKSRDINVFSDTLKENLNKNNLIYSRLHLDILKFKRILKYTIFLIRNS